MLEFAYMAVIEADFWLNQAVCLMNSVNAGVATFLGLDSSM